MNVTFKNKNLDEICNDFKLSQKMYGKVGAKRLQQRLQELRIVNNLAEMRNFPGRCHELKGNLAMVLSLDLNHPFRLLFKSANDPIPCKEDGGLDWTAVTAVEIIGVEDTHG